MLKKAITLTSVIFFYTDFYKVARAFLTLSQEHEHNTSGPS